ncbi:MAG: FkbM family methyltransferase [Candidatus Omnitrophica bacterium]|nr:FkbM family methyltransferase [Candidatus Omnitrophota bacterium]
MDGSKLPLKTRITGLMTIRDHTFLYRPLGPSSVVVDLGAHKGEFSKRIQERFGCRCLGVEANPELAEVLVRGDPSSFRHYAISSNRGQFIFHLADNPLASTLYNLDNSPFHPVSEVEVPGIPFEDLLQEFQIAHVDLLKVDIEGAEVDLFDSTSSETLSNISQIAVEFHDFCHFISSDDVRRITDRLIDLGFFPVRFMGNENTLFVNQGRLNLSLAQRVLLKYIFSPTRTVKRILGRARRKGLRAVHIRKR